MNPVDHHLLLFQVIISIFIFFVLARNLPHLTRYLIKSEGEEAICLTPSSAYEEDLRYRFADCVLDMPRNRIICVA